MSTAKPLSAAPRSFTHERERAETDLTTSPRTYKILFVCAANSWRSPAAEFVFRRFVSLAAPPFPIQVDSAGVCDDNSGMPVSWVIRWVAFLRGCRIVRRSRRILRTDLTRFDLVIAMDRAVRWEVKSLHSRPTCRIALLSDFLEPGWPIDAPDPAVLGLSCINRLFGMIEAACPNILAFASQDHYLARGSPSSCR